MTIVGYWVPGDRGYANNTIVVQDNRRYNVGPGGAPEADNNLYQHDLPFCTPVGGAIAPWQGYVTINVPEPGTFVLLVMAGVGALLFVWRKRRTA